ncbi:hypothetical protein HJFPF1_09507 [Paramyrothecium foliicola]|nr:hypothetical protein HJFPF1_09507 [Paramyrothecium foliicola]
MIAQMINLLGYRKSFDNSTLATNAEIPARPGPIGGILTNFNVKRLMQNSIVTWIIIGLLIAIGRATMSSVVLERSFTKVLPKNPPSIAAMASLWADSNIFDHFPGSMESTFNEDYQDSLEESRLRIGWITVDSGDCERKVYTIRKEDDNSD